jgi:valyl-tRNA synthetase
MTEERAGTNSRETQESSIAKVYDPTRVESEWYARWVERGYFHADPHSGRKPFVIVIPPPNVTGILHMGHALNNTLQDILIRWKKLQGYETLWLPGVDHAGIATQNVVERELATRGTDRHALGREKFVEEVWKWKERHGDRILRQLRKLGASCDWSRERFTMDEMLSRAVREAFVRLFKKGLIYRGTYIINWCPRCETALSDEEAEHEEVAGKLYYIHYPLKDGTGGLTVATTRPETMLGDTAVAVNPDDERYKAYIGTTLVLPLVGREIPVIADPFVDPEFGTGAVKVTPAHDPNDFEMGERHNLPRVNVLAPDGSMSGEAGAYRGMDRFACREKVLEDLVAQGFLQKVQDHMHAVGHCYRCHTMVEPYLSRQWFVKMKPLAAPAVEAVRDGRVRILPPRWEKVYFDWMENIRDWCISRQIWWGHRIPIWTCRSCGTVFSEADDPERCTSCASADIRQEEDVLDTWFSSWLWPFSTLGWPGGGRDLEVFYPTDTLITASEIIFFWVARMIMAGLEFMGEIPFRTVIIHGTVRDETGTKMSKSLGNAIDPEDIIDKYGADALRFSMVSMSAPGSDIYLSDEKFHFGRNFANKLWNASRYLMMNVGGIEIDTGKEPEGPAGELVDRWIMSRFQRMLDEVESSLENYRFNEVALSIHSFFWHDYCDWYLELIKPRLLGEDSPDRSTKAWLAWYCLDGTLRALHPVMPFITEEIWNMIPHEGDSITRAGWPAPDRSLIDGGAEKEMEYIQSLAGAFLNIRGEYNVHPAAVAAAHVSTASGEERETISRHAGYLTTTAKLSPIHVHASFEPDFPAGRSVVGGTQIFIPLEGIVDLEVERRRLGKEVSRLKSLLESSEKKLARPEFLEKAPEEVIRKEREKRENLIENITKTEKLLEGLV